MTSKFFASAVCGAFSLTAFAAHAQTPAAPAAPAQTPVQAAAAAAEAAAPSIPGICVYSQELTVDNSIVGKYVAQRLQQLQAQANAELTDVYTKLQTEENTLNAQAATMTPEQRQQAAGAFQQKAGQAQQLQQVRQRELQLTQQSALGQVMQTLNPAIIDSFTAHKCAVLIDRNATLLAGASMDITSDLTARLDSKLQQFPFDKVTLPQDGGGQPAGAPTVSAPTRPSAAKPAASSAKPAAPAAPAAGAPARTRR